jgi:hypothetical protein
MRSCLEHIGKSFVFMFVSCHSGRLVQEIKREMGVIRDLLVIASCRSDEVTRVVVHHAKILSTKFLRDMYDHPGGIVIAECDEPGGEALLKYPCFGNWSLLPYTAPTEFDVLLGDCTSVGNYYINSNLCMHSVN